MLGSIPGVTSPNLTFATQSRSDGQNPIRFLKESRKGPFKQYCIINRVLVHPLALMQDMGNRFIG